MSPNPPPSGPQGPGMPSPTPAQASIWLRLALDPRTHPEIYLRGLEYWLELGLISDAEVRLQCGQLLSCPLQNQFQRAAVPLDAPMRSSSVSQGQAGQVPVSQVPRDRASAAIARVPVASAPQEEEIVERRRSPLEVLGATVAAEFSLNWLLALGVFVVVVSSGALAASQWQQVSNLGQYAILWGYTLAFFAAGLWLSRSEKLRLTGQMVRAMALFLVPMNAWAMDGLGLWSRGLGGGLAVIAALSLVVLGRKALSIRMDASPVASTGLPKLVQGCALVLSGLQWGWGLSGWPLVATYAGAIVASLGFWYGEEGWSQRWWSQWQDASTQAGTASSSDLEARTSGRTPTLLGRTLMVVGIALLLARAGIDPRIPIPQLGLAIGILGWQLGWIARSRQQPDIWTIASAVLLVLGWQLTFETIPVQALGVSVLAAWIVGDRLRRLWTLPDVLLLFGLVVQGHGLVWLSLPESLQQVLVASGMWVFGSTNTPDALVGLGVFPAVGLAVWGADWLRRREQPRLANGLEGAAFALWLVLAMLAALNPGVRAVYFAVSTGMLAVLVRHRPTVSSLLVYLTHVVGGLAAAFAIDALFPQIGVRGWGTIAIVGTVLEWAFVALLSRFDLWRRSSWYIGLMLGGVGFLTLQSYVVFQLKSDTVGLGWWGLGWFVVPIASAVVSQRASLPLRLSPLAVTIAGLIAGQLLILDSVSFDLAGWAIAAVVMAWLTYCRPTVLRASFSLGFALFGVAIAIARLSPTL
ncbi:MAG: hypothetical protein AAF974_08300, partial [Cyanobacteria bacterium P01_E01_bin.34]